MKRHPTKLILPSLALAALILLGWRFAGQSSHPIRALSGKKPPIKTDYYMRDATIYQFDKKGRREYRMTLDSALHYPDGSAELETIFIRYQGEPPPPWTLTATRGSVPPYSDNIHLKDGVRAVRPLPDGNKTTAITDNAWVLGNTGIVETGAHVKAFEPGREIEGDGMYLDTNANQLRLLQNVQVTQQP